MTAAAAYRAADAIADERTGIIHDYSRKAGVLHTEIIAPENTPDWMLDRTRLWNAVELAEKRKDAQLAREIQLSLPHELTDQQRRQLVQDYVRETFTPRGIIADIAIHRPGKEGDDRNHHAHILLTMRTLTGEGFGPKVRSTPEENKRALAMEREAWAEHQNRALERAGHSERVDHRSYADRMIDREPTKHLGPNASEMERTGKGSRIGDENRRTLEQNSRVAEAYRRTADEETARTVSPSPAPPERPMNEARRAWYETERKHQVLAEIDRRERLAALDLDRKHQPERIRLEADQRQRNGVFRNTIAAERDAIDRRMEAKGVTRFFRNLTGITARDSQQRERLEKTLRGIDAREAAEKLSLAREHQRQQAEIAARYDRLRAPLLDGATRTMSDDKRDDSKKTPQPQEERSPPKKGPELEGPTPPFGAGRGNVPPSLPSFEQWRRSEAGQRAGQEGRFPRPSQDQTRAADPVRTPADRQRLLDELNARPTEQKPEPERSAFRRSWDEVNGPVKDAPKRESGPERGRGDDDDGRGR